MQLMTSTFRVYFKKFLQLVIAICAISTASAQDVTFPRFRHVDAGAVAPLETLSGPVRLLTDQDFAPFSYVNAAGQPVGLSVEMAQKACFEIHLTCEIKAVAFADLVPALLRGDGDAVISGVRTTPALLEKVILTRPYFFSSGQFITRVGMPFDIPDIRTLAGRRVGFVKGTSHEVFLQHYYDRSALTPFPTETEMLESLRTGKLDVAFTDSIHAAYWLKGTSSRQCCVTLGKALMDRATFTRGLAFLIRQDHETLREYFDYALDQVEENGEARKIMSRYMPELAF